MQSIHVIERKVERACCLEVSSIVFMCISITNYSLFNGLTLVEHHKKIETRIGGPPPPLADKDFL